MDRFYSTGGSTSSTSNSISTTATNNPAPAAVYQTERYGSAFSYTLPNLVAGQVYTVRLHFAEIYFTQAGKRQFNVAINGSTVLTNFDIWAATGSSNAAIVKAFPVAANSSGQITISFSTGAANNPKVSGIELVTGFRIGAGGGGASYWEADQSYLGGSTSTVAYSMNTSAATDPAPAVVYQYDRYGFVNYTIHGLMPGTTYDVRLHFADWVYQMEGQREFDVQSNGAIMLTNYDIVASAGGSDIADIAEFLTSADSSGQINLFFYPGQVDGPIVSGIELTGGGGSIVSSGQYLISGFVKLGGSDPAAVADVTVTLSGGQSGVTVSAADGSYSFIVNAGGSYVISAAALGYSPSPAIPVNNIGTNQLNTNFTLTPATRSSKEYIYLNGAVIAIENQ